MSNALRDRLAAASTAVEYQRLVLEEVRAGRFIAEWTPLEIVRGGRKLILRVFARPLAIGSAESPIYVMASATLQQLIADELRGLLPTSLVMDEIHRQATGRVAVDPLLHAAWVTDGSMAKPRRLLEQSELLAKAIDALPDRTLVADGWKTWALAKGLADHALREGVEQAFNHGLYKASATGVTLGGEHAIQVLGTRHGRFEIDYSQLVLLMADQCAVDGVVMATADVLGSAATASLLSDEGVVTVTRQPGHFGVTAFGTSPTGGAPVPTSMRATLRLGSVGPDVRVWQQVIGAHVDGQFGPIAETRTRAWQAAHGLTIDGVVGPATWRAAAQAPIPEPAPSLPEGIDVSSNQGTIDFDRVKAAGAHVVYLRASDGVDWTDSRFLQYAEQAKAAGLPVGAYHYLRARPDAAKQATQFAERFQRAGCTLIPMLDCEPENNPGVPGAMWLEAILAFAQTLEVVLGCKPFIYGYPGFLDSVPALTSSTELATYPLWIADYALQRPNQPWVPRPWKQWTAWQYAAGDHRGRVGRIDGVSTDVDRNRFTLSVAELSIP